MMRMEVRSFHVPRWLGPVIVLAAILAIPFMLTVTIGLIALVVGATIVKALLPASKLVDEHKKIFETQYSSRKKIDPSAIDAEYEVKDKTEN